MTKLKSNKQKTLDLITFIKELGYSVKSFEYRKETNMPSSDATKYCDIAIDVVESGIPTSESDIPAVSFIRNPYNAAPNTEEYKITRLTFNN